MNTFGSQTITMNVDYIRLALRIMLSSFTYNDLK